MNLKSILLGAALGLSAMPALADIIIKAPYARAASPMAHSGAAFMVVHNTGPEADRLLSVSSDAAKKVSLHTNVIENGVAKMPAVPEGFEIAPGADLLLQRGGNHVMMMGLTAPFVQDKTITVTLTFEHAGDITVTVPIDNTRDAGGAMDGMNMGDNGAMDGMNMDGMNMDGMSDKAMGTMKEGASMNGMSNN